MTGPEHYGEAERLLGTAGEYQSGPLVANVLAEAQVHATLALAAAIAGLDASEGPGGGSATGRTAEDSREWERAVAPLVPTDGAS